MGAVFQGPDAPPRATYSFRARRALPAVTFILVLSVLAGLTWLKVVDEVNGRRAAASACGDTGDPNKVQLRVYNATGREGLAKVVAEQLTGRGYAIVGTGNDPLAGIRLVEGSAEVRYGPGGQRWAEQVRKQVPRATLYKDGRGGRVIDVVLGDKFSRVSTDAELAKGRQGLVRTAAPVLAAPDPEC